MSPSLFDLSAGQGVDHFTLDFIYVAFEGDALSETIACMVCRLLPFGWASCPSQWDWRHFT